MKLYAINPAQLDMYWGAVEPFIALAMDFSPFEDVQTVYDALDKEQAQLWVIWDRGKIVAAVVTRLEITKTGNYCNIWACAGKGFAHWVHLIREIEDWARKEGCTAIYETGRPGLARKLKQLGYKPTHIRLEKALPNVAR